MKYWLMKSEPDVYSIDDLSSKKKGVWEGVRNYQARNHMRAMDVDDLAFFYHSSTQPPGIVGVMKIIQSAYPDPFQFDSKSQYYDEKSTKDNPRWSAVDVGFVEKFEKMITLDEMKEELKLEGMIVLQKGSRLSVMPVEKAHFLHILKMKNSKTVGT